jgi:hypothetical protein
MFVHPIGNETIPIDARKQVLGWAIAMPAA